MNLRKESRQLERSACVWEKLNITVFCIYECFIIYILFELHCVPSREVFFSMSKLRHRAGEVA